MTQYIMRHPECLWRLQYIDKGLPSECRVARFLTDDCEKHPFLHKNGVLVSDPWRPLPYQRALTCATNEKVYPLWEENYEKQKHLIKESLSDVEQADIVYVVAPGPSLPKNVHHLTKKRHGVVVGLNIVPKYTKCDYFACMDYGIKPEACFNGNEMIGVFSPQVNWEIPLNGPFTRKLYGIPALSMPLFDKMRDENPGIPCITTTPNVALLALEWAALYLKPKVIVLLGFDFCATILPDGQTFRMHPDGHDDFIPADIVDANGQKVPKTACMTIDIANNVAMYIDVYTRILKFHIPFFWFLIDHGIRVINATEGGLLWENCDIMPLAQAIGLCNLYGDTKDESVLPQCKTSMTEVLDEENDPLLGTFHKRNKNATTV